MRRSDIPEALCDPSTWPGVDSNALESGRREVFQRRQAAVIAYLGGASTAQIEQECKVHRGTLQRMVARCLAAHPDGRIQGLRALIPHVRAKSYQRLAPALRRPSRGGLTGAMGQLFERLPQLHDIIEREIVNNCLGMTPRARLYGVRDVQAKLLAACREAGIGAGAYPLNQDEMGYRSLARWVRRRLQARVALRPTVQRDNAWDATIRPFSVAELDGHKLDVRLRVRFVEPSGLSVDLESERLFVIALIDVCTRVVLGWQVVPAPEYDHNDVLAALQDALRPRRKRDQFVIAGCSYRAGAGFVADVLPELAYACWDVLKVDNAASHLTEDTFAPICRFVGCRLEAGPVGEPKVRPYIERFFGTLTDRVARKVHGSTGRSPQDPVGKRGKTVPVELLVTLPELEELLDVSIANYHATPHDGLNGRTPLEALQLAVAHAQAPVRTLPQALRARLHQLQPVNLSTVRGNTARSVAPYVSLYGARYSNEVVQRTQGLVGQKIRVYANPSDMREAWAYLQNGAELGRLAVLEGWRYSRHTLRLRRQILRERRVGKLKFAGEQDPVQMFAQAQRRSGRRGRKQATVAMQLAQVQPNTAPTPAPPVPARQRPAGPVVPVDLGDLKVQNR